MDAYDKALGVAHDRALGWLDSLGTRPVPPQASIEEVIAALGPDLPQRGCSPEEAVELLARACDPGLTAMASGRFFGYVIGGTHPAALAADWLVSAWDQNSGLRTLTPAHSAVEDVTSAWLLDLLGLPTECVVGFTTGATMANFTGLVAGRDAVLRRAGWDVAQRGLTGGPSVRVLVGAERHDTVDLALRYLGLGAPEVVEVDDQGRIRADALEQALEREDAGPVLVVLQAGNIHSGACDPFTRTVAAAHRHGAWVHVDGAFGLWAGASPAYRRLVQGYESADSWATDAHKTLNVPYDSGLCIVRDAAALQAAMGAHGAYLVRDETCQPLDKVPELSRRGRTIPVWAVLRCLGRDGVAELVERLCRHATAFADALRAIPGVTVLNDVAFTQVCATFGSDEHTDEVVRRLLADGTTWMTGSTWHGQRVLRISVSNWSTTEADVHRCMAVVRSVVSEIG